MRGTTGAGMRAKFRTLVRERRQFAPDSMDREWRTNAARKIYWLLIGRPSNEWGK